MAAQMGVFRFAEESWSELKKVAWPSPETVVRLTIIVLLISGLVGAYIFLFDNIFTAAITRPIVEAHT
jgi:preprotein translocase SecE subunit